MSKIIRKFQNFFHMLIKSGLRETLLYIFYRVRNELCRVDLMLKGVRVGKDNFYYGRIEAIFHKGGRISIGDKNNFGRFVLLKVGPKGEILVGNNCTLSRLCFLQSSSRIVIENGAQIAAFVHIIDANHDISERYDLNVREIDKIKDYKTSPVIVGRNAWVGSSSVILAGVTIGEGAVVGAGSVVTRDIPPYSIAVGVPCKVIKIRK